MALRLNKSIILRNRNKLVILLLLVLLSIFSSSASLATNKIYQSQNPEDIKALLQDALNGNIDPNHTMDNGATALMVTALNGDVESANQLLKMGADPTKSENDGFTPMMLASEHGYIELVDIFVKEEVNPNTPNNYGWTALMIAAHHGHMQIVEHLLDHGADPTQKNNIGFDLIQIAFSSGHLKTADILHDRKIAIKNQSQAMIILNLLSYLKNFSTNKNLVLEHINDEIIWTENKGLCHGLTALWLYHKWLSAQYSRNSDNWFKSTVEKITKWDGKKELSSNDFFDFEKFAILANNLQLFEAQIDSGKAIATNKLDTNGKTLQKRYTLASSFTLKQLQNVLEELANNSSIDNELIYIHFPRHVTGLFKHGTNYYYYDPNNAEGEYVSDSIAEIAEIIFHNNQRYARGQNCVLGIDIYSFNEERSAYPNQQNLLKTIEPTIDSRALTAAAEIECLESLIFFLDNGADPNTLDQSDMIPLMHASDRNYIEIVDILLNNNRTNPSLQNNKLGRTALMYAAQENYLEIVKKLLEKNANPNLKDSSGFSALTIASQQGHTKVISRLLKITTDPNHVTNEGFTALMVASENNHLEAVEKLLSDKRINPNQTNQYNGMNALLCAARKGHDKLVDKLIPITDDPNATNIDGKTALIYASENGHLKTVEILLLDPRIKIDQATYLGGRTALMYAAIYGHAEVIKKLLEKGADPNKQDNYQHLSAIDLAERRKHKDCVKILKKYQYNYHREL